MRKGQPRICEGRYSYQASFVKDNAGHRACPNPPGRARPAASDSGEPVTATRQMVLTVRQGRVVRQAPLPIFLTSVPAISENQIPRCPDYQIHRQTTDPRHNGNPDCSPGTTAQPSSASRSGRARRSSPKTRHDGRGTSQKKVRPGCCLRLSHSSRCRTSHCTTPIHSRPYPNTHTATRQTDKTRPQRSWGS